MKAKNMSTRMTSQTLHWYKQSLQWRKAKAKARAKQVERDSHQLEEKEASFKALATSAESGDTESMRVHFGAMLHRPTHSETGITKAEAKEKGSTQSSKR